MDNMGTNDEPNTNRTRPNPQDDRDNAVLGKIVLRPHSTQRHVFTLEHVQKKSDVDLLSAAPLPLRGTRRRLPVPSSMNTPRAPWSATA